MLELDKYIADTIGDDDTILALMGGTFEDTRLYSWEPPFDVEFTTTYPGAIFYMKEQFQRPEDYFSYPSQKGDMSYRFQIVANDKTLVNQIAERLIELFDDIPITTDNWRVLDVIMSGNLEGVQSGTATNPLYSRLIAFRFNTVLKRDYGSSP